MVVVEGVARSLNPDFNMWTAAEPVVRHWIERRLGPAGQIERAAAAFGRLATTMPAMLDDAQRATAMLADMARSGGLRIDPETAAEFAKADARHGRTTRFALIVGALALVAIALNLAL
jgi:ubiquinone biosynthesis protein